MDLLERYLQAVRFLLPKKQRHDVDQELSEDLRSQIEEREAELGRPLVEDELAALLKAFGHPVSLALRYQPDRHLIGPAVFPLFWFAVRFLSGVLAIVHILVPTVYFVLTGEPGRIVGLYLRFPSVLVPALAWVTLAFAILETPVVMSAIEKTMANWNPRALPPLVKDETPKPPSAAGVVATALFSLWWLVGLRFPYLLLGPAAEYIAFAPIFHRLYVPMALAAIAGAVVGWLRLSRPHSARLLWTSGLLVDAVGLVILYLLSNGGVWVVAGPALSRVPGHEGLLEITNLAATLGLKVALLVTGVTFAWKYLTDAGRPWGGRSESPRAM